ncbi:ATPase [Cellulosimicrobium sp. SH8]|uniref:ATPase n=1 Tax=Cellulosimicrobium sp. SH8 TaxID=2952936 RepID=UPI0021F2C866|nr:ATPase [Cellulosimicrobium sp. SH8]
MSTTTEAATWPRVEATLNHDGTAEVSIGGTLHPIAASSVDEARVQVVSLVASKATQLGRPLRAITRGPDGEWPLIIHGDGTVTADSAADARPRSRSAEPVAEAAPVPAPTPAPPAATEVVDAEPVVQATAAPDDTPAPASAPRGWVRSAEDQAAAAAAAPQTRRERRESFLTVEQTEEPATEGLRGILSRVGFRMAPSEAERAMRECVRLVSQHWPGPRTTAIVNGKGGASKTPTTAFLAAVFARYGGAGVVTHDNNQTRGTLGWRTEQGPHDATFLELLPEVDRLLGTAAQSADLAHFVHHQTQDKYDVLRSQPMILADEQRLGVAQFDAIHAVLRKYYRLIFMDSGNDESDSLWLRMVENADRLVVATTTRGDIAEAGALLLEALADRDERSAALARNAVVVVNQAKKDGSMAEAEQVAAAFRPLAREAVAIPYDPAMVEGTLRYGSLRTETQRAWLAAAAAVARGL